MTFYEILSHSQWKLDSSRPLQNLAGSFPYLSPLMLQASDLYMSRFQGTPPFFSVATIHDDFYSFNYQMLRHMQSIQLGLPGPSPILTTRAFFTVSFNTLDFTHQWKTFHLFRHHQFTGSLKNVHPRLFSSNPNYTHGHAKEPQKSNEIPSLFHSPANIWANEFNKPKRYPC